jgi:cyclophilin family peptidyl-prolyl cis-trans isomerase
MPWSCEQKRVGWVSSFLNYVHSGYYTKTLFHRVIPGFVAFGKVTSDLAVVDGIAALPTGVVGAFADVPLTDVVIQLVVQTK